MVLSDLSKLQKGPVKSIISVCSSTWNLLEKANKKTSGENVLFEEFIPECTVASVYSVRGWLP